MAPVRRPRGHYWALPMALILVLAGWLLAQELWMAGRAEYLRGQMALQAKDYEAALRSFGALLANHPNSRYAALVESSLPECHLRRAEELESSRRYVEAKDACLKLIDEHPNTPAAERARTMAIECLAKAVRQWYGDRKYAQAADGVLELLDAEVDLPARTRALQLGPEILLAAALATHEETAPAQATQYLQELSRQFPGTPEAKMAGKLLPTYRLEWARALEAEGQKRLAERHYTRIMTAFPDHPVAAKAEERLIELLRDRVGIIVNVLATQAGADRRAVRQEVVGLARIVLNQAGLDVVALSDQDDPTAARILTFLLMNYSEGRVGMYRVPRGEFLPRPGVSIHCSAALLTRPNFRTRSLEKRWETFITARTDRAFRLVRPEPLAVALRNNAWQNFTTELLAQEWDLQGPRNASRAN